MPHSVYCRHKLLLAGQVKKAAASGEKSGIYTVQSFCADSVIKLVYNLFQIYIRGISRYRNTSEHKSQSVHLGYAYNVVKSAYIYLFIPHKDNSHIRNGQGFGTRTYGI